MLGRYDRAMRARQPVGRLTLLQQAIAAIRRNNGALFYVPSNFAGAWTDSAGTDPVDAIGDVIGRMTDRTGGSAVATQATTANKPTVQINAQGRYVMRFDGGRNDSLTTNITTGNEGWVCAGVTFGRADVAVETVFCSGAGNGLEKGVWLARIGSLTENSWRVQTANGSSVSAPVVNTLALRNTPRVVEGGWTASTAIAAVDGVEASSAKTGDATSAQTARIGADLAGAHRLSGHMTAQVICPVLPSAADRAIIRKWVGSLQGQTL